MTVIAAIKTEGAIFIGADRAVSINGNVHIQAYPKIVTKGGMLFGLAGACRIQDLIAHSLVIPKYDPDISTRDFMVTSFNGALRSCLKDAGSMGKDSERDNSNGAGIIAYRGHLFCLHYDFSITEYDEPYLTLGSGGDIALGSLFTTEQYEISPRERISSALAAAAAFVNGVAPPFDISEQKIPEDNS